MKILIVDDSRNMRRMIRLIVKDLFDEVWECGDGSEALAAYAEGRPDWVLMDIRMKEMDGLAATRQIKSAFPQARIIIVTVCLGDDMREAARAAGATDYVVKDDLLDLRRILANRADNRKSQPAAD